MLKHFEYLITRGGQRGYIRAAHGFPCHHLCLSAPNQYCDSIPRCVNWRLFHFLHFTPPFPLFHPNWLINTNNEAFIQTLQLDGCITERQRWIAQYSHFTINSILQWRERRCEMTANIADLWHWYYTNKLELCCQHIKSDKELLFFVGKSGLFCKKCKPKCGNPTKIVNLFKRVINRWMVKGRTKWC